jgi:1-acyl-sn-glycerol-3-phosphate acyltransferase
MIRATLVYLFVGLYVLLFSLPAMLWTFLTRDVRLIYRLSRFCIRAAGYICRVRVIATGTDKILPGKTYVFLSNHQGNFDAPVLYHVIPRDCRALIKKEMMKIPLLSLVMKQLQFVPIERTNAKQAHVGIDLGAGLLKGGIDFLAFPEGTRSRDGRLGEFKKGVFIMAIKAQVDIVPITIVGSRQIQPPGRFRIKPGVIHLFIHDPISTIEMGLEDRNQLVERTRKAILSELTD